MIELTIFLDSCVLELKFIAEQAPTTRQASPPAKRVEQAIPPEQAPFDTECRLQQWYQHVFELFSKN